MTTSGSTTRPTCYPTTYGTNAGGAGGGGTPNPGTFVPSLWLQADSPFLSTNGARSFNGSSQYLSMPSNADVQADGSFFISCWFYGGSGAIVSRWGSSSLDEYLTLAAHPNFECYIRGGDGLSTSVVYSGTWSATVWNHFLFVCDTENALLRLYFNSIKTQANGKTSVQTAAANFAVGVYSAGLTNYFSGNITQLAFGKPPGPIADVERDILTTLYNNGNPFSVADISAQQLTDWGCTTTRWELNERSGNAVSVDGTYTLTDTGGVGEALGPPTGYAVNSNAKNLFFDKAAASPNNLTPGYSVDSSPELNNGNLLGSTAFNDRYKIDTPDGSFLSSLADSGESYNTVSADTSGNGRDGTNVNQPQRVASTAFTGAVKAMSFDGVSQYTLHSPSPAWNFSGSAYSFSMFVRFDDVVGERKALVCTYDGTDGYQILYEPDTNTIDTWNGAGTTTGPSFNPVIDTWYHIFISRPNGSTAPSLYIDGSLVGQWAGNDLLDSGGNNLTIANGRTITPYLFFPGDMDEVRIYSADKSADIATLAAGDPSFTVSSDCELRLTFDDDDTAVGQNPAQMTNFADVDLARTTDTANGTYEPTSRDGSGNNRHGSNQNAPQRVASDAFVGASQAMQFDGVNQEINESAFVSGLNVTQPATLSFWYRGIDDTKGQTIYSVSTGNGQDYLYIMLGPTTGGLTNEVITVVHRQNNASPDIVGYEAADVAELFDGSWHHVMVVSTGQGLPYRMFLDGSELTLSVGGGSNRGRWEVINNPSLAHVAGLENSTGTVTNHVDGDIDELRLYSSDKSADIATLATGDPTFTVNTDCELRLSFDEANERTEGGDLAISFDGVNDVSLANAFDASSAFVIEAWIKRNDNTTPAQQYICNNNAESPMIRFPGSTDSLNFYLLGVTPVQKNGVTKILANEWTHVLCEYDPNGGTDNIRIYVNGVLDVSDTGTGIITGGAGNFSIGADDDGTLPFNGLVGTVRIFNGFLSSSQVYALYKNGTQPSTPLLEYTMENSADGPRSVPNVAGGYSLDFNGSDDGIDLHSASISSTQEFTFSAWIKYQGLGAGTSFRYISCSSVEGTCTFAMDNLTNIGYLSYFDQRTNWVYSNFLINDGAWHHIVAVRTATTLIIYADGVSESFGPFAQPYNLDELRAIGYNGVSSNYVDGLIEDPRIYSRVLTPAEILDLYNGIDPPTTNLVLHHKFDDGPDFTGTLLPAASENDSWAWDSTNNRWVWEGNGTDRYIELLNINILQDFSISIWIQTSAGDASVDGIFCSELNVQTYVQSEVIHFSLFDGTNNPIIDGTTNVRDGQWHHIVAIRDAGTIRLYVDNVADGTANDTTGDINSANPFAIGARRVGSDEFFNGNIRDAKYFDRAISEAEIAALFTNTDPPVDSIEWTLNDGPNLPGQLLPADGTQDQQWTPDEEQGWAWKGDQSTGSYWILIKDDPHNVFSVDDNWTAQGIIRLVQAQDTEGLFGTLRSGAVNGWMIALNLSSGIRLYACNDSNLGYITVLASFSLNQDYRLTVRRQNGTMQVFYDGAPQTPTNTNEVKNVIPAEFSIGSIYSNSQAVTARNIIKDVKFTPQPLSDADILANNWPTGGSSFEYKLDEGISGNTVTDGLPINTWQDRSLKRNVAAQFGVLGRPLYRAADGDGNSYLEFDGVDDALQTLLSIALTNGVHCFVVGTNNFTTGSYMFEFGGPVGSVPGFYYYPAQTLAVAIEINDGTNPKFPLSSQMVRFAKTLIDFYAENVNQASLANNSVLDTDIQPLIAAIADDTMTIGGNDALNNFLICDIYEIILYPNRLSDDDALVVREWLAAKYNIVLSVTP